MPAPLLIPLIMAGISAASQAFGIGKAAKEGKRQRELGQGYLDKANQMNASLGDRPQMNIPQSYQDATQLMNVFRRKEMPGMSQMLAQQEQAGATTRGAAANLSGADAAAVLLGEGADRMRGLRQIGLSAAQYGQQQDLNYFNQVNAGSQWEQMQWQQNQLAPWEIGKNEEMGYRNAGNQMFGQGADTGAAAGIFGGNMLSGAINTQFQNPNSLYNQNPWQGWGGQGGGQAGGAQLGVPQGYQQGAQLQSPMGQSTFLPGVNQYGF